MVPDTHKKKTTKKDRLTFLTERSKKICSKSHMPYHNILLFFLSPNCIFAAQGWGISGEMCLIQKKQKIPQIEAKTNKTLI